jgi:shikimate dehydrogenase
MADQYAVIGNPIGHTKSPLIHMSFAEQSSEDIAYTAIEGPLGGFAAAVDAFRTAGGLGLNVTAPFKLDAFSYATKLNVRARMAGAVNALKFIGKQVHADNFDGVGLVRDITHNLGSPLAGRRVLLLGAGGAARGAMMPFLEEKPSRFVIANRTMSKAEELAAAFASFGQVEALSYPELIDQQFDLIVNATSASLVGELPPLNTSVFAPGCLAYELVYGKGLTPFLRLAQGAGVQRLSDGVGMLVEQAAEAFAWWRGVRPETRAMIDELKMPLV